MNEDRLNYLIMRCDACGQFMTKLEIIRKWEEMESNNERKIGLCQCGSRKLRPSNLTPDEEELYESEEQKKRYYDDGIVDRKTRIWELFDKCVDGKDLGERYAQ